MAIQPVNIGQYPNDTTGDPLRTAFEKINAALLELQERIDYGGEVHYHTVSDITDMAPWHLRPIWGLIPSVSSASTSALSVSPGSCRDDRGEHNITFDLSMTKYINAVWSAGGGFGMLDVGTVQPNTGYHIFAIYNPTTQAEDMLASTSYSAPVMPAGYTARRCITSIVTDASSQIRPFLAIESGSGLDIRFYDAILDLDGEDNSGGVRARQLSVPVGVKTRANIHIQVGNTFDNAHSNVIVRDPDLGGNPQYLTDWIIQRGIGQYIEGDTFDVYTNASGQLLTGDSQGTSFLSIRLNGYHHRRY